MANPLLSVLVLGIVVIFNRLTNTCLPKNCMPPKHTAWQCYCQAVSM
ncbi:hypothetical protein FLA_4553 [Filimonas lacunae]|nr:hypothetical protein FLA_4553 [Filimonas lacunae]